MLEEKARERTERVLEQLLIHLATNQRALAEDEYKKFMNGLTKNIKAAPGATFNRDKMEELRLMTNLGANKAR